MPSSVSSSSSSSLQEFDYGLLAASALFCCFRLFRVGASTNPLFAFLFRAIQSDSTPFLPQVLSLYSVSLFVLTLLVVWFSFNYRSWNIKFSAAQRTNALPATPPSASASASPSNAFLDPGLLTGLLILPILFSSQLSFAIDRFPLILAIDSNFLSASISALLHVFWLALTLSFYVTFQVFRASRRPGGAQNVLATLPSPLSPSSFLFTLFLLVLTVTIHSFNPFPSDTIGYSFHIVAHFLSSILFLALCSLIYNALNTAFSQSFTLGELIVVVQFISLVSLNFSLNALVLILIRMKSFVLNDKLFHAVEVLLAITSKSCPLMLLPSLADASKADSEASNAAANDSAAAPVVSSELSDSAVVGLLTQFFITAIPILILLWRPFLAKVRAARIADEQAKSGATASTDSASISPSSLTLHHRFQSGLAFFAIVFGLFEPFLWFLIGEEPFSWLGRYLSSSPALPSLFPFLPSSGVRLSLIVFFAVSLLFGVSLAPSQREKGSNILRRKYFHLLAIALFVFPSAIEPDFLSFAFAIAVAVLVLLEAIRYSFASSRSSYNLLPGLSWWNRFCHSFLDSRDSGSIILTHLYLLLGLALPIWIHAPFYSASLYAAESAMKNAARIAIEQDIETAPTMIPLWHLLPILAGFLALGLGDTAASAIGVKFGSHRWPGSKKTIEGTVGAAVVVGLAGWGIQTLVIRFWPLMARVNPTPANLIAFLLATVFASLFEAFTQQIDNLLMPIFYSSWLFLLL